jgi:hypothetical protein
MPSTLNAHRGEAALTLGGNTYRLRPSFSALVRVEEELGSLIALVERAGSGALGLKDIVVLLHACALAGGHDISRDDFAAALLKEGITTSIKPLRDILAAVMGTDDGDETD